MNKRGVVLIICYIVIVVLSLLAGAFLTRSISERSVASKYFDSTQAFWLAEAGVNKALVQLRNDYGNFSAISPTTLGPGEYSYPTITSSGSNNRTVTASGFVPSASSAVKITRVIEAIMSKRIPTGFYDYAIYAAGDLERKGNVNGKVIYAGTATGSYKDPQPTSETPDSSISPLASLDFDWLRTLSKGQLHEDGTNNYHDADHLNGPFPASFWYSPGVPNVVFLEGSLTLGGGDTAAGFFVVGGGDVVYDATIGGGANIDGCVYTRGDLTNNGGGGADFNIKGVWVGGTAKLGGSSVITYDVDYMNAIKALGINAVVQVTSWRETQNPY
jgi:hypothetical protein